MILENPYLFFCFAKNKQIIDMEYNTQARYH